MERPISSLQRLRSLPLAVAYLRVATQQLFAYAKAFKALGEVARDFRIVEGVE